MAGMNFDLSSASLFVIGNPVHHSVSPQMHQAVIDELGLPLSYAALKIPAPDDLKLFFDAVREVGIRGLNVTVPYKEAVIPYLDRLDEAAARCGAVNTVVNQDGVLSGYNTDGLGLLKSLEEDLGLTVFAKNVLVIGAGGAARGIIDALCRAQVSSVVILNRTLSNAQTLQYDMEAHYKNPFYVGSTTFTRTSEEWQWLQNADIIIQTTSVGLAPDEDSCPVPSLEWVRPGQYCIDIIYKPLETAFLKQAKAQGATTLNGVGMLAGQGAAAFELFTGKPANYQLMKGVILHG